MKINIKGISNRFPIIIYIYIYKENVPKNITKNHPQQKPKHWE
jgi:hypothetical protein